MYKCEKCGSELEPNAKFCTNCGEKVSLKTTPQNYTPVHEYPLLTIFEINEVDKFKY